MSHSLDPLADAIGTTVLHVTAALADALTPDERTALAAYLQQQPATTHADLERIDIILAAAYDLGTLSL